MIEDSSHVLWITSRRAGVNKLSPYLQRFAFYRHIAENPSTLNINNVYSLLAEDDATLWAGTNGGGLNKLDRRGGPAKTYTNDPGNPHSLPTTPYMRSTGTPADSSGGNTWRRAGAFRSPHGKVHGILSQEGRSRNDLQRLSHRHHSRAGRQSVGGNPRARS